MIPRTPLSLQICRQHSGSVANVDVGQGHLCVGVSQEVCSVQVVVLHLKKGVQLVLRGGAILL